MNFQSDTSTCKFTVVDRTTLNLVSIFVLDRPEHMQYFQAFRVYKDVLLVATMRKDDADRVVHNEYTGLHQYTLNGQFVQTISGKGVRDFLVVNDRIYIIEDYYVSVLSLSGDELQSVRVPDGDRPLKLAYSDTKLLVVAERVPQDHYDDVDDEPPLLHTFHLVPRLR